MKKIYLLLIVISFTVAAHAQWTQVYYDSLFTGFTLRDVAFANPDTGWAVGGVEPTTSCKIVKTVDGGASWTEQTSPITTALRSIYCINADTCVACGFSGKIIKTTDGGSTWTSISSGTTQTLRSIAFTSSTTGFICGGAGTMLTTTDGGDTWSSVTTGITNDFIQIRFADENVGFATSATSTFTNGTIYKTSDGGSTWTSVYTNTQGLLGLGIVDENVVYAGGGNNQFVDPNNFAYIVKSTDGGSNWSQVYQGIDDYQSLRAAAFTSADKGWFVGDVGALLGTQDGGSTWVNDSLSANGLLGIKFINESLGFASGNGGIILKYSCPIPATPDLSSDPLTVCSGDTLVFSISEIENATGYKWILPEGAVIIDGDGTTTVTVVFGTTSGDISVFATGACTDGEAAYESVTVNITPDIPTITFDLGVLTSTASSGNQWYYNGVAISGATDQTYTPSQNGTYSVIVTSAEGCSSESEPFEVIGVGVGNVYHGIPMTIFPNPMNQSVQINIDASDASGLIISDVQGRLIMKVPVTSSQLVLSRENLSEGIYTVQLINDKNELISRMKLIVQ